MAKLTNSFATHNPLEKGKYADLRKFINHWLTRPLVYCNNCGLPYYGEVCCDNPEIGKNIDHCWAVICQNKARRLGSGTSANQTNTFRLGLSMPPTLLRALEKFSMERWGEKLFSSTKDIRGFMKAFPQFCIPERI